MSNNIYDILKKFNNLDSVKNMLTEGKKVNEAVAPDEDLAQKIATIARSLKPRRIFEPIAEYFDDSLEDGLSAWNDMGYNDWTMDLAGTVSERLGVDLFELWKEMKSGNKGLDEGSKPDFLDMDKDGDKKEPMKKAAKEKSKGAVAEAVAQVEKQLNEKYMGFKKLQESEVEESGLQAYLGKKKYGETGMKALQKAGRDGASKEKMATIRAKHDKMDEGDANEDVLSPKQKKFAKLAPPPDKITYADKIAGAKQGMKKEGNAFSGAMAKAKASGADEFKVGSKEYKVQEGFPTVADAKKRMDDKEGKTTHGKKTSTATGTKHERDYDAVDKGADVDTRPKGRGRPKKDRFA